MTNQDLTDILGAIRPGSQWTLFNGAITAWLDTGTAQPTDAEIQAQVPNLPTIRLGNIRNQAVALASDPSPDNKLIRAVLLTILDQINVLRAQLSLSQITVPQAKAAVSAKINSGAAD